MGSLGGHVGPEPSAEAVPEVMGSVVVVMEGVALEVEVMVAEVQEAVVEAERLAAKEEEWARQQVRVVATRVVVVLVEVAVEAEASGMVEKVVEAVAVAGKVEAAWALERRAAQTEGVEARAV